MWSKFLSTLLWLVTAFTLTTQELVRLSVTPKVSAGCGQQVTLNCNVSSSRDLLSIKHMGWSHNKTSWCSVDSKGTVVKQHRHSKFHCEYRHGHLSLIIRELQPLRRGGYMCKLQSNRGSAHEDTEVVLQECHGIVNGEWTSDGPLCIVNDVYPDGDVHWFQGPRNLSGEYTTTKRVNSAGSLTIESRLSQENSDGPYNCSLWSTTSGRYISSTMVTKGHTIVTKGHMGFPAGHSRVTQKPNGGVGSMGPMGTFWLIPVFLIVILK